MSDLPVYPRVQVDSRTLDQMAREVKARRESMAWAVDKLRRLKRNLEYCTASCEEIAQALDEETNPRLKKGD